MPLRSWMGEVLLKYLAPLGQRVRGERLRAAFRSVSGFLVPRDTRVWVQCEAGVGRGLWMKLNARSGRTFYKGEGEPEVQKALEGLLRPGMIFYDVGANIGFFSLIGARLVGSGGRVYAFEVEPEAVGVLRENVERNGFTNVTVVEKAVWRETGTVLFARSNAQRTPDWGCGKISEEAGAVNSISVPATTLGDFAAGAHAPQVIKCDVEGAEAEVFNSARSLLQQHRPSVVCELHSPENRKQVEEIFNVLDYNLSAIDESHLLAVPK